MEQKTDKEGIFRDMTTGALLNKNNGALLAYKKRKEKEQEHEKFKQKFNEIDGELSEIKSLLKTIAEKI